MSEFEKINNTTTTTQKEYTVDQQDSADSSNSSTSIQDVASVSSNGKTGSTPVPDVLTPKSLAGMSGSSLKTKPQHHHHHQGPLLTSHKVCKNTSVSPRTSRSASPIAAIVTSATPVVTVSKSSVVSTASGKGDEKKDKKKKKKARCYLDDCNAVANKLVGHCQFCNHAYCTSHRLLENHKCENLQTCKNTLHKRNADKLSKEQTIVSQVQF